MKDQRETVKLVVVNEHTLGYTISENNIGVLRASILKGATEGTDGSSIYVSKNTKIRLASKDDFNEFGVSFDGYENDKLFKYVYQK